MCSPTVSVAAVADCSRHVWTNQSTRKRLGSTSPAWGQPGFTEVKDLGGLRGQADARDDDTL